ncbi:MAG: glycosyltransferase family 39 protein [Ignavibacteriales bacterium]|nr:glycosyltransferase family 39 protein [Ignavibacteriales bacterium]
MSLLFILIFSFILRIWQIGWGLPELYEEATPLRIAWGFWNWGNSGLNLNPNFFNYPALTFYIQFIGQVIHYGIGNLAGYYPNLNSFGTTITPLAHTARIIDLLFDILTILVVYKLASEFFNKRTAIIASLILALNPLHIKFAHLIQVDTALTFFSTLSTYYIFKLFNDPKPKWYYAAGISMGLAVSSKYTGAFLLLFFAIAHLLRFKNSRDALSGLYRQEFIVAILISVLVFVLLNPYILLTPNAFEKDFSFEQQHMASGHLGISESQSTLSYYFLDAIPSNFGWLFYGIIFIGIASILKLKERINYLTLIYPLIFLIFVSTWIMRAERYILPIFPVFALIGAIGTDYLINWVNKRIVFIKTGSHSVKTIFYAIFVLLILLQPTLDSIAYLKTLSLPDTRAITKEWIKNNIPKSSIIATGPYGVDIRDGSYRIFDIPFLAFESERVIPFYDSRWYEDLDLVVTSSYDRDRYASEPQRYKDFLSYYDSLNLNWELIFEIKPNESQTGHEFRLYKYRASKYKETFTPELFQRFNASPESSRISNFLKELADILIKKGRSKKAEQIINEILTVEYENLPLRNQLGDLLIHDGKYEQGLNHLAISIKQYPAQPQVYLIASRALRSLKKYTPAEAALLKALEYRNDFEPSYIELIGLFKETGEKGKLLDILKRYYASVQGNEKKATEIKKQIDDLK